MLDAKPMFGFRAAVSRSRLRVIARLACGGGLLIAALAAGCSLWPGGGDRPPDRLVDALARGVNLSHWWTGSESRGVLPTIAPPDAGELARLRGAGLSHVRLPVDPARVFDANRPRRLRDDAVTRLHRDISQILDADLAVIVVLQMQAGDKAKLFSDGGAADTFLARWRALAGALADLPADRLALELLNEPEVDNPWAWGELQGRVIDTVRAAAPRHTLIVTGAHYSDPVDLVALAPYPDDNLIYTFHFYTPHNFTHQGATWGWDMWRRLAELPYPSSPDAVEAAAAAAGPDARPHVEHYGRQAWDRDKLAQRIALVRDWAGRHNLVVQCSEFGVIRKAPQADRERWLRDARTLMEEAGFGWTVWDYAGEFALVDDAGDSRRPRDGDLRALGL